MNNIGFLDTEGKLHKCESWEHLDKAWEIVVDEMGIAVQNRLEAEEYLQKLGWIVIRAKDVYGLIGYYKEQGNEERYHLTDIQKKWLEANYESFNDLKRESVDEMFEWDK